MTGSVQHESVACSRSSAVYQVSCGPSGLPGAHHMSKTKSMKHSRTPASKATPDEAAPQRRSARGHKLNAFPDTLDFRDRMYVPTLVEVPTRIDLKQYRKLKVPILNQGQEGA